MNRDACWSQLTAHSMAGWRQPAATPLPGISTTSRLLWCGIGGSLLPTETLVRALGGPDARRRWTPLASPEPCSLELQPSDQLVFASKSGKTLELWTWIGRLRGLPGWGRFDRPPAVITQDDQNPLAQWARAEGWPILPIPVDVGGRYSAFTPVGTLPLAWMGRDPGAFLAGARQVLDQVASGEGLWGERVWSMVETLHTQYLLGVDTWVLMPYALRLEALSAWWAQLMAESLGKTAADGSRRGIDPVRAVGPLDQHSQLQRWMEGPRNLGVHFLTVDEPPATETLRLPPACPYPALARLQGAEILAAQAQGTREALEEAGVPTAHWHLGPVDEACLGSIMMAWQLIVGLTGFALEVNPFDQPGVEAGKIRTFRKLGLI